LCYGTEIGDGLQNDRILSFFPLILCEKQLNPQHADTTQLLKVLQSDWFRQYTSVIHENLSIVTRCSFSPCTCRKTPGPQD